MDLGDDTARDRVMSIDGNGNDDSDGTVPVCSKGSLSLRE